MTGVPSRVFVILGALALIALALTDPAVFGALEGVRF